MEQERKPRGKLTHTFGQLIYDKGGKNTQWRKDSIKWVVLGKLDSYM